MPGLRLVTDHPAVTAFLEAALDQPRPSAELRRALNHVLKLTGHDLRERRHRSGDADV